MGRSRIADGYNLTVSDVTLIQVLEEVNISQRGSVEEFKREMQRSMAFKVRKTKSNVDINIEFLQGKL